MSQPSDSIIDAAAKWLATGGKDKAKAVIPQIRDRFNLSAKDACEVIRRAALIHARSH